MLVELAGNDPEVASVETTKRKRKLGKSHPDNEQYEKFMLYIQSDLREVIAEQAFRTKGMDMSDIINQILAEKLGIKFLDPSS